MIDPANVALYIPNGLKDFKQMLFERVAQRVGHVIRGNPRALLNLPREVLPAVGCSPELRPYVQKWREEGRRFIYWDRGYARRVFATWLPRGTNGGYYRWHVNSFQMMSTRIVKDDRWRSLSTPILPWQTNGRHIVIARPTPTYEKFHGIEGWTNRTVEYLSKITDRQLVIRDKESRRPLQADLQGAHCLVAHASIAAVEAVICGCPVFVDRTSAAALVGKTTLDEIEKPRYPSREHWAYSLAYCQFNEQELIDGTLWKLIK